MTPAHTPMPTLVLVDGSNVARCSAWRARMGRDASDHDLRRRLVDAIGSWAGASGHEACVTFDGAGPWRAGSTQLGPGLEVYGSGSREGDDVIERRAADARSAGRAYWVVTSDVALRRVAGAHADRVIDADSFVAELAAPNEDPDQQARTGHAADAPPAGLAGALDEDTRARLERLRRGLD